MVEWLFLAVPWDCLRFVIVVFPDHTHLLFLRKKFPNSDNVSQKTMAVVIMPLFSNLYTQANLGVVVPITVDVVENKINLRYFQLDEHLVAVEMLSLVLMMIHSAGKNKSTYFYFSPQYAVILAAKWNDVFYPQ